MTGARGTSNTNVRGSAANRRRRKLALLERDGNGQQARCWECGRTVTYRTMICDRIKPGIRGGRYGMDNLRIHCPKCSEAQGRRMGNETRRWKAWERRGLTRTRVGPDGFRESGRWFIHLDDDPAPLGHVTQAGDGKWMGVSYLLGNGPFAWSTVTSGQQTMRDALYVLLSIHTYDRKKAA
jgi:hypothetical protein